METINECCICGQLFLGDGNNPWPIVSDDESVCCNACNFNRVIPARINLVMEDYDVYE